MASFLLQRSSVTKTPLIKFHFHGRSRLSTSACSCLKEDTVVRIGNVSKKVKAPKHPELVPRQYLPKQIPTETLKDLKWMMQKDLLGQDIFLLGRPGPLRRLLAQQYLQLTAREMEYVALSRDTTEADLKQRREITAGTSAYLDQSAVKAATLGRVLVLEGIEKVERNVLPVLNNLLENREMHLEDGRLLIPASRYDSLLAEHGQEVMDRWRLVRVSEDFRVIALGLPVPRYAGSPLDPPLRSRFQARDVRHLPYEQQLQHLMSLAPAVDKETLTRLLSFSHTLLTEESSTLGLPDFPVESLDKCVHLLAQVPELTAMEVVERLYPYKLFLPSEGQKSVEGILQTFHLLDSAKQAKRISLESISHSTSSPSNVTVELSMGRTTRTVQVKGGSHQVQTPEYVETPYHSWLLADLVLSHSVSDLCLVGPRGCGKSALVRQLAATLGFNTETIQLYQDMTARDLLQQRTTTHEGDTVWRLSPLVEAALEGRLAVLDGLHRAHKSSLAVLQRLVQDRELQLYDGTRLMGEDKWEDLKATEGLTDHQLLERGVRKIHPAFRIVALAEPPQTGSGKGQWLTPEILPMFIFHNMRSLSQKEERQVISEMTGSPGQVMEEVLATTHRLRASEDASLRSIATSLSTRQLLRVGRRLQQFPNEDAYSTIGKACLARFLPALAKDSLDKVLERQGVLHPASVQPEREICCTVSDTTLTIGQTVAQRHAPETRGKVPETLFYDTPQNLAVMEAMLQDYLLGEHLLLVGNQGVGKNKLVDRLLNLLNKPREYIQLNRDTTVQTLTLQPTVRDGVIVYDDSPLVQAVKTGNILVIDEADKAPTNVTCILKSLVETGEMILSDGRKIVSSSSEAGQNIIRIHPHFRMIVLANRPGFPFLGNDFFGALGDLFSCHAIDNPSMESELSMLRQYGPNVSEDIMRRLVKTFAELRSMADEGQIQYPYSTREVVNIVKHLEKFPDDGLGNVVRNVFDFDSYTKEVRDTLTEVLHKHGIPIGTDRRSIRLAKEISLPERKLMATWELARGNRKFIRLPYEESGVKMGNTQEVNVNKGVLDRVEARGVGFSELQSYFSLPFHDFAVISDVAVARDKHQRPLYDTIHALTTNPVVLYTMQASAERFSWVTLNHIFDTRRQNLIPRPRAVPLAGKYSQLLAVYDEVTGNLVLVEPSSGTLLPVTLNSIFDSVIDLKKRLTGNSKNETRELMRLCPDFAAESSRLLFYSPNGRAIQLLDIADGQLAKMELPFNIRSLHPLSEDQYLITASQLTNNQQDSAAIPEPETGLYLLRKEEASDRMPTLLNPVLQRPAGAETTPVLGLDPRGLSDFGLKLTLGESISTPNTLLTSPGTYACLAMGFPQLEFSANEVLGWPRPPPTRPPQPDVRQQAQRAPADPSREIVFLKDSCQIIRPVAPNQVPNDGVADHVVLGNTVAFLEVVDLMAGKVRYVPVPEAAQMSTYAAWYKTTYPDRVLALSSMSADGVVTADNAGTVRLWETGVANLERSLEEWRRMIGSDDQLQLTIQRDSGLDVDSPKHGKIDPENAPHVGGNTWAGGTGGRDTAGLGGKGGPYRLDAGHAVHQLSQEEKDNVPEHVKKAARDMNRKAFAERLREIKMSEYDAQLYEQYAAGVRRQVQTLRTILTSLQAKSKDRTWLKNQTSGELDDNRLIDGLTGEKSVYKKRGEQEPEVGTPQEKPKRFKLVVDVSGSMYRFNGHDQRLERTLESALMVMEALDGFSERFKYDIVGHSGEESNIPFTLTAKPPANEKERLRVLKEMHAHAQFCMSGDHTLSAAVQAINDVGLKAEDHDESFVIVMSDANFDRYGIRPESFAKILNRNENVNAYAIFIGSLGNQAAELTRRLPSGKAFVCLDTRKLPEILQTIFTSTMLN